MGALVSIQITFWILKARLKFAVAIKIVAKMHEGARVRVWACACVSEFSSKVEHEPAPFIPRKPKQSPLRNPKLMWWTAVFGGEPRYTFPNPCS